MITLLALWLLLAPAPAQASSSDPLWAAYQARELVTARRLAEEELARMPRSARAHLVLGFALAWEEGRHAAARHHLDRAERLSRKAGGDVHQDALWNLAMVTELMDDRPRYLVLIRDYQRRYGGNYRPYEAWSLLKLGRYEAAREAAQVGIDSHLDFLQAAGFTSMCAIEAELMEREAAYTACKAAFEHARARGDVVVDGYNASEAATSMLRFDEARSFARAAVGGSADSSANPHERLLRLALIEGDGSGALQSVQDLMAWNARHPPEVRDLAHATVDGKVATFLLVVGRSERGLALIDRALRTPDRAGLTSSNPGQSEGTHVALRLALRRLERVRRAEDAATRPLPVRWAKWLWSFVPDPADIADRARLRGAMEDSRRLLRTFRVYGYGGLFFEPWFLGELAGDLGPGVYRVAVARGRAEDANMPELMPYYDALEVDADFAGGRCASARARAEAALPQIGEREALLRARLYAIAGECAWRAGDGAAALAHLHASLSLDPGTVRRMGIALPGTVEVSGGDAVAVATGAMLRRSPRLRRGAGGFRVLVSGAGDGVRVCLLDPHGAQLSCSSAGTPEGEEPGVGARARHHALRFTERAFALPTPSTLHDLDSLDGRLVRSPDADRVRAEKLLEAL